MAVYPLTQQIGSIDGAAAPSTTFDALVSIGLATGMIAVVLTIALAMPCALWLLNRGVVPLWKALACGVAVGNLPLVVVLLVGWLVDPRQSPTRFIYGPVGTLRAGVMSTSIGLAASVVFWLIAIWTVPRRAD